MRDAVLPQTLPFLSYANSLSLFSSFPLIFFLFHFVLGKPAHLLATRFCARLADVFPLYLFFVCLLIRGCQRLFHRLEREDRERKKTRAVFRLLHLIYRQCVFIDLSAKKKKER